MPYTGEQEAEFKRQFAVRRRRQVALAVPMFAAILVMMFVRRSDQQELFGVPASTWGVAFLILVAGAIMFSLRNWRCPACDRYLGRQRSPKFCPKCGVALQ